MRGRDFLLLLACAGMAVNCGMCASGGTPGEEGEECTFDDDCREGLRCVLDKCAAVTADAGNSDAATGDAQGTDRAGTDRAGTDRAGTDASGRDLAVRDATGVDLRSGDRPISDQSAQDSLPPTDAGPHDLRIPDRVGVDTASRDRNWIPDWTGFDWVARDLNIFIDGGGVRIDAGIVGYDGGNEPGVICGGLVCNSGQHCCIAATFPPVYSCAASCLVGSLADLSCDDPGDCRGECCATDLTRTECTPANQCLLTPDGGATNGALVCAVAADCAIHSMDNCCSSSNLAPFGVDLGWCQVGRCQ